MTRRTNRLPSQPPALEELPLLHARTDVEQWLHHYWRKLRLPSEQLTYLAITEDRSEFARWTGRRLNPLALGCYCYLPLAGVGMGEAGIADAHQSMVAEQVEVAVLPRPQAQVVSRQPALPGFFDAEGMMHGESAVEPAGLATDFRHLIFIEPDLEDLGTEVTVAHELIHLSDRVRGQPRKHHCHGHDSISVDEAAITGRDPELLRRLLAEETARREEVLRTLRPYRYIYECPVCGKEYPRVRRYSRAVSCGRCFPNFNASFLLRLRDDTNGPRTTQAAGSAD